MCNVAFPLIKTSGIQNDRNSDRYYIEIVLRRDNYCEFSQLFLLNIFFLQMHRSCTGLASVLHGGGTVSRFNQVSYVI